MLKKIKSKKLTLSIVSHGQFDLIFLLLDDLRKLKKKFDKIIITINIPEKINKKKWFKELPILWIYNETPYGFGKNHNNAFINCKSNYFCILNPDIRIQGEVFQNLIIIKEKENINIIGPEIKDMNGILAINSRQFPDHFFLLKRILRNPQKKYFFKETTNVIHTDWLGGMLLIISKKDFTLLNGFDKDYFLYFEDVDICKRARNMGFTVAQSKHIIVTHQAQRQSRTNIKYFFYHIKSYYLYFKKHLIFQQK